MGPSDGLGPGRHAAGWRGLSDAACLDTRPRQFEASGHGLAARRRVADAGGESEMLAIDEERLEEGLLGTMKTAAIGIVKDDGVAFLERAKSVSCVRVLDEKRPRRTLQTRTKHPCQDLARSRACASHCCIAMSRRQAAHHDSIETWHIGCFVFSCFASSQQRGAER